MTDDFDEFFDDELAEAESVPEPASDNVAEADVTYCIISFCKSY